jgi:outer membrane receptor protein involved in Fe transport
MPGLIAILVTVSDSVRLRTVVLLMLIAGSAAAQVRPYPDTVVRRPTPLPAVTVADSSAPAPEAMLEAVESRGRGSGQFITRAEIEKQNPLVTSDLLRRRQGFRIIDSAGTPVAVSTRGPKPQLTKRGSQMGPCAMLIGLNGSVSSGMTLNAVPPSDIHGIEIHTGSTMPPEFTGSRPDTYCGIVMIWTR